MSAALAALRQGLPIPIPGIFDVHGHLGRYGFAIPGTDPALLVGQMDRLGVARIAVSHMHCMKWDWESLVWGHDRVREAMERHPGRILGYFSVLPDDGARIRDEAQQRLGEGFRGIKLHNGNGYAYDHPGFEPLWAIAHERGLPVLFHTWGGPELDQIGALAARWPGMRAIAAHAGSQNVEAYVRLAQAHPNVFLDTCLSKSPRGLVERLVKGAGAHKILWGSDAHFFSLSHQLGKAIASDLTEGELEALLSGNAQRVFGGPAISFR